MMQESKYWILLSNNIPIWWPPSLLLPSLHPPCPYKVLSHVNGTWSETLPTWVGCFGFIRLIFVKWPYCPPDVYASGPSGASMIWGIHETVDGVSMALFGPVATKLPPLIRLLSWLSHVAADHKNFMPFWSPPPTNHFLSVSRPMTTNYQVKFYAIYQQRKNFQLNSYFHDLSGISIVNVESGNKFELLVFLSHLHILR